MSMFRKFNVVFVTLLFILGCSAAFAQEKQTDKEKEKKSEQTKQEEVFDASSATLEQAQNWLKKTLIEYKPTKTAQKSNMVSMPRIKSVTFKGCEAEITNSTFSKSSDNESTFSAVESNSMSATTFRNFPPNETEYVRKSKIDFRKLDAAKTVIVDRETVAWVQVVSLLPTDKNSIKVVNKEESLPTVWNDSRYSYYTIKPKAETFVVRDKQVANQVKEALIRVITLCQQNP